MPDMKNSERVWPEPDPASLPSMPPVAYGIDPAKLAAITLSIDDLNAMSKALGQPVNTAQELVRSVQAMSTIRVHNVEVVLEPGLLHRLKSRCLVPNFSVWLRDEVLRWAHNEVGW